MSEPYHTSSKKTQRGKCHLREGKGGYPSNNPQGHEAAHQIRPRAAKQLPLLPLRAPGWRKVVAFLRKMSPSEGLRTRLLPTSLLWPLSQPTLQT